MGFRDFQELAEKRVPLLCPERICDIKFNSRVLAGFKKLALKVLKRCMHLSLVIA